MKRSLILLLIPVFILSCNQMKQADAPKESQLSLSWSFQGNNAEAGCHSAAFVLENQGDSALTDKGWTLYYNQLGLGVIDESVTGNVQIEHINGSLLKITPLDGFSLEPGNSVEIAYRKPGWLLLESEAPLQPYVVYDHPEDETPMVYAIAEYKVLPFPSLEKVYPVAMDVVLPDAEWVYGKNLPNSLIDPGELGQLIPKPVKEAYTKDVVVLK